LLARSIRPLRTLALCLALACLPAMQPAHAQTYTPLTLDQTVALIGGGLTSKRVVTLITERGVDYRLTPTAIERLHNAGADADEIAAIGTNYRAPAPQPAPKPDASSASLADTLQFIQTHLNQQGAVSYSVQFHDRDGALGDGTNVNVYEASRVVGNASSCRIDFHWKATKDGEVIQDFDAWVPLGSVVNVIVATGQQQLRPIDTAAGHPNIDYTFSPMIYVVNIILTGNISESFVFYDQAEADRVSAAIIHAAKLCGGAKGVF